MFFPSTVTNLDQLYHTRYVYKQYTRLTAAASLRKQFHCQGIELSIVLLYVRCIVYRTLTHGSHSEDLHNRKTSKTSFYCRNISTTEQVYYFLECIATMECIGQVSLSTCKDRLLGLDMTTMIHAVTSPLSALRT